LDRWSWHHLGYGILVAGRGHGLLVIAVLMAVASPLAGRTLAAIAASTAVHATRLSAGRTLAAGVVGVGGGDSGGGIASPSANRKRKSHR